MTNLYEKNMIALGFIIQQGAARVRRRWYKESDANFDTIDNYKYDETGRLLKTTEEDLWFQCIYSYDEAGRIVRQIHEPMSSEDPNPATIDDFYYDQAGRITRKTTLYKELDTESSFSFDVQGRISTEHKRHLSEEGATSTDYRFIYDASGRLQIVEEIFLRGTWSISTYHYDEQGRLILIYNRDSYSKITIASYEYIEETSAGTVLINENFAIIRQQLESQTAFAACDFTALSDKCRCLNGVDLGVEFEDKLVMHLRTGCYAGPYDSVGDWPESIVKSPTLSPLIKRLLVDILHRCLTHPDPVVRIAAVGILDTSAVLRDDRQIVLRMVPNWPLFAGLQGPDDSQIKDRGLDAIHMLAARANALDEGRDFIRNMAFDSTYGGSVLAALTNYDPDWVVDNIERLITLELDPKCMRLAIIFYNMKDDKERPVCIIQRLRGKMPNEKLDAAIGEFKSSEMFNTLHNLLHS